MNPFIYAFVSSRFRREFQRALVGRSQQQRRQSSSQLTARRHWTNAAGEQHQTVQRHRSQHELTRRRHTSAVYDRADQVLPVICLEEQADDVTVC